MTDGNTAVSLDLSFIVFPVDGRRTPEKEGGTRRTHQCNCQLSVKILENWLL
jgi:hypothetical protein